jgi:oxalate decarboxylase/phosphoglucose isomerase-like protein (cupin superfamily)
VPDGVMLLPRAGERIVGGGLDATVKVTTGFPSLMSSFEMVIPPGYDVGAHLHEVGEEVFFVIEGELDMFAFEPQDRSIPDWHEWRSAAAGEGPMHGGPGTFMFVPEGCPHAFGNPGDSIARMFFQSSVPGGHENYFVELAELLESADGRPDPEKSEEMRRRWHIEQLTPIAGGVGRG